MSKITQYVRHLAVVAIATLLAQCAWAVDGLNYTWRDGWDADPAQTVSYGAYTGETGILFAGQQMGIVAQVKLVSNVSANIINFGGDNRVVLATDADGKYTLSSNIAALNGHTSETAATTGWHRYSMFVRRGVNGSGHAASVIVYEDGNVIFKITDGSFVTGPFRNLTIGGKQGNLAKGGHWSAHLSAGAATADEATAAAVEADCVKMYPPVDETIVAKIGETGYQTLEAAMTYATEHATAEAPIAVKLLAVHTGNVAIPENVTIEMTTDNRIVGAISGAGTVKLSHSSTATQGSLATWIGEGKMTLGEFTGTVHLASGRFNATDALVPAAAKVKITSGAQLFLDGGTWTNTIELEGAGYGSETGGIGRAALRFENGNIDGASIVTTGTGDNAPAIGSHNSDRTFACAISGSGDLRLVQGMGSHTYTLSNNSFTGALTIVDVNLTVKGSFTNNAIKGAGTIIFDGKIPTTANALSDQAWTGKVWVKNYTGAVLKFKDWTRAGLTLKLTNVAGWLYNAVPDQTGPILELADEGENVALHLTDGSAYFFKLSGLKGSGTLKVSGADAGRNRRYAINSVADFTGSVIIDDSMTNARVLLGGADENPTAAGAIVIRTAVTTTGTLSAKNGIVLATETATLTVPAELATAPTTTVSGKKVVFDDETKTYSLADPTATEIFVAAIAAAADGATVTLGESITLADRIDIVAEGKSITIDLNEKTITPTATCGNGSAFNIVSGTVTIKNGTIDGTAITTIECDPITVRSGAAVVCETLTISICSQTGACVYPFAGATATIKSGTYTNTTTEAYPYGSFTLTLNQSNVADQLIFVEGGSFTTDPAKGDDAQLCKSFLASGYVSTLNEETGLYDVTEKTGPTSWETVTDGDVTTIVTDLPTGKTVSAAALSAWASANKVDFASGITIPVNALIFNCAIADAPVTEAAAEEAAAEILEDYLEEATKEVDLAALLKGIPADGKVISVEGYPMATIKLVPSKKLESTGTAKFFQLSIELK